MFPQVYNLALTAWRQLYGYALINKLANGSPMPRGLQTAILAHYPVVLSLVLQGRRTAATDLATHARLLNRLSMEFVTLHQLAERFADLSVVAVFTTAPWTAYRQMIDAIRATDPELAGMLPDPNNVDLTLGLGTLAAAAVGVLVLVAAAK
jgi:hypothetical protein